MLGLVVAVCKSVEPRVQHRPSSLNYSGELCYVEKHAESFRRGLGCASLSNVVPTE